MYISLKADSRHVSTAAADNPVMNQTGRRDMYCRSEIYAVRHHAYSAWAEMRKKSVRKVSTLINGTRSGDGSASRIQIGASSSNDRAWAHSNATRKASTVERCFWIRGRISSMTTVMNAANSSSAALT